MRRTCVLVALAVGAVLLAPMAAPVGAVNEPLSTVVSANPVDNTPHVLNGKIFSIVEIGNRVVVAGQFTQVRNNNNSVVQSRVNIFSYDPDTGLIDPNFVPVVNGAVNVVERGPEGDTVFIGGAFSTVNGVAQPKLAKLRVADGSRVTQFSSNPTAAVYDAVLRGTTLYVGGSFLKIKGQPRTLLAAVDATSGAVSPELNIPVTTPVVGTAAVKKLDVTPDGSKLVLIGNFQYVGGAFNRQAAMIDLATSPDTLANWHTSRYEPRCSTSYDTYMRDVDFSPDGSYFVIVTTGAGYQDTLCDTAARFETAATGQAIEPLWVNYTGGDTLYSVAVTNAAVYVGGHQRWLNNTNGAADVQLGGAVSRPGIGALDPLTGVPLSWNPTKDRGVGTQALTATARGLYIGSDTTKLAKEYHARLGFFPVAGGTVNPTPNPATLPADLYTPRSNGTADHRSFDGTSLGGSVAGGSLAGWSWSSVRGAFVVNGTLYTALSDGSLRWWSYDGTNWVNPVRIAAWTSFSSVSSMSYSNGNLLLTYSGDSRLYRRWFSIESKILGSEQFTVDSGAAGISWSRTVGATVISGKLYAVVGAQFFWQSPTLQRVDLSGPYATPVGGTNATITDVDSNISDLFAYSA